MPSIASLSQRLGTALAIWAAAAPLGLSEAGSCKCFPGETCWPSAQSWAAFNQTISGRLVKTIPIGTPCHNPNYNAGACTTLQETWTDPATHYDTSSSIMAPFWANQSCDPFTPRSQPCKLGNYVLYAVDVHEASDVQKALAFAQKFNIRVVIRNTGHDYNGKSTGAGALAIWTHHLKSIQFKDWNTTQYTGKAIKMGTGVQAFEAYTAAQKVGLAVVGGECDTVGLAGGYSQGGGHSALSSTYGLGADQVLEFEVVDGQGRHLIANKNQNSDLYWAMRGGGGSAYAVALSMTSKAHPDIPIAAANLTFTSTGLSKETYYAAIEAWNAALVDIVDAGVMAVFFYSTEFFAISPMTGPGLTKQQLTDLFTPYLNQLDQLGVQYTWYINQFPGMKVYYDAMQGKINVGIAQYGGWLMPRSVIQNNNAAYTNAWRQIIEGGSQFIGVGLNVGSSVVGNMDNAVNPSWRQTLISSVPSTPWNSSAPWSEMIAWQQKMTNEFIPLLSALAPNSGVYLNEADPFQPNWQQAYYGGLYPKLRQIKGKYDPNRLFYARGAVGSDEWTVTNDGHLCTI